MNIPTPNIRSRKPNAKIGCRMVGNVLNTSDIMYF